MGTVHISGQLKVMTTKPSVQLRCCSEVNSAFYQTIPTLIQADPIIEHNET